jgi:hypothetical protein
VRGSVEFRPITLGPALPGVLAVSYEANSLLPAGPLQTTLLVRGEGVATAPIVVFSPAVMSFGTTTIGVPNPPAVLTVSMTPGDLIGIRFSDIRVTGPGAGDYQIDASQCLSQGVTSGAPCRVLVTFTPTAIGVREAFLEFITSPGAPPRIVSLTGSGAQPTITLNPAVVHSGGVIGLRGDQWPPGVEVTVTIPSMPGPIRLTVRPDGTVELPTVIFHSNSFGPREVMAHVTDAPAIRLAQPVVLLVEAPGAHVVDMIGRR